MGMPKETRAEPGIHGGQQHQQRREPGVDVPVGGGPPGIGPVGKARVRLGIAIEVGVLVRMPDDEQRGVHVGGEPVLGMIGRADRFAEPGHVGGGVEHQETPPLREARRRRPQAVAHDPVKYLGGHWPAHVIAADHTPPSDNVVESTPASDSKSHPPARTPAPAAARAGAGWRRCSLLPGLPR
jgi:hypothetical protein